MVYVEILRQAQSATLTIAQAFNLAYSYWLAAHERRRRKDKEKRSDRGKFEIWFGEEAKKMFDGEEFVDIVKSFSFFGLTICLGQETAAGV